MKCTRTVHLLGKTEDAKTFLLELKSALLIARILLQRDGIDGIETMTPRTPVGRSNL